MVLADNVDESTVPSVKLPISLTVVRHQAENIKKSSVLPLKALCRSSDANLEIFTASEHTCATLSELNGNPNSILLFPCEDAVDVAEIEDWTGIENIIAIDSTWSQAKQIIGRYLPNVKTVKINKYKTTFWRYNDKEEQYGDSCLATIEAIYYFIKEIMAAMDSQGGARSGEGGQDERGGETNLDDILYFYEAQWHQIRSCKRSNPLEVGRATRDRRKDLKERNFRKSAGPFAKPSVDRADLEKCSE
ncbi:DTW domain protein [Gregarina niphandrodes]|uniref:tRNA-uridine aminocarboxypropyltransferase 1 n=1 Tax=Gregarina niphandrodes TaxID=110365 RepID=A0A023BA74_GRENI|nr:DTW domain protein [Gregarina niphandrodes]EZG77878.1 DTW domain protein [Gregarina niphandrodes]|eukprot:XP_011129478.1 DTW domain protein [Gregarina niphandrodes]